MIRVTIRIDIDQIVELGEHHSEIEVSTDRIIEEMTLGEEISEEYKLSWSKI